MKNYLIKFFKLVGGILFLLIASFTGFLIYALRPGISPQRLPHAAILKFSDSSTPTQNPNTLKIVTYNIGYASGIKNNKSLLLKEEAENNLRAMADVLKKLNPDILFLQEVDFDSARTFGVNQFQYLADALGMPYGAYVLTWNKKYVAWPYWPPSLHFGRIVSGQGVLSRYPITKQDLLYFPRPASNPFWYNWFYLDRVVQHLTIEMGNRMIKAYHVHIEAFDPKEKVKQLKTLTEVVVKDHESRRIVAGDFNLASARVPGAKVEEIDIEGMLNQFSETTGMKNAEPIPPPMSMPSHHPVKKIDHIFYDPSFQLIEAGNVSGLLASDHLPIWATLNFIP